MRFLKQKKGFIPSDMIEWQLDRYAWLIDSLCPSYGPLRSVFLPLNNHRFLDAPDMPNTDDETVLQAYAQVYLDHVKQQVGMTNWNVSFIARDKSLPKRDEDKELIEIGRSKPVERYYTDALGRPILYFEVSKLGQAGYLTRRIAMGLSGLIMVMTPKPTEIETDDYDQLINIVAAFLGFGLVPLALAENNFECDEQTIKAQVFATAIFLKLKGYNADKLQSVYGDVLSQELSTQLSGAFDALAPYQDRLARLKARALAAETQCMAETG